MEDDAQVFNHGMEEGKPEEPREEGKPKEPLEEEAEEGELRGRGGNLRNRVLRRGEFIG